MEKFKKVHCLFEQSGTFKSAFEELGFIAEDYDIQNDYGQTDHVCDLFMEFTNFYLGKKNIFDDISSDDLVIAFFPCTYFECQSNMFFEGTHFSLQKKLPIEKIDVASSRMCCLSTYYGLFCTLFKIAATKGFQLIVENPYQPAHFLTRYFPIKPAIIDKDRRQMGDYYQKPTQYWFFNCTPNDNLHMISVAPVFRGQIAHISDVAARSEISSQYAINFIKSFVL